MDSLQYATHCQHTTARHITELLWTVCSTLHTVSTQLHDTLQNCCGSTFAALLHTVAVTRQYITSAGHIMSHYSASPLQSDPTSISKGSPASPYSHLLVPSSLSNICLQIRHRGAHHPCHCTQLTVQQWHNLLCSEGHGMQNSTVFKQEQICFEFKCGWWEKRGRRNGHVVTSRGAWLLTDHKLNTPSAHM